MLLVHPLYLDFVEILACTLDGDAGFADVQHNPLCRAKEAPNDGGVIRLGADGRPREANAESDDDTVIELEEIPIELIIEELAHAIVAHRRNNDLTPPALSRFVDLFTPRPESVDREKLGAP